MKILHLMSCRGWSSDAYWAARVCAELERAGQEVTLTCKRGSEARVMERARQEGASRIDVLAFGNGIKGSDMSDLRRLIRWLPSVDLVHVHRGKEHWLAALANLLSGRPRPLVRTRHIALPVRPHALNRWLYRRATDLVVTVTEAIRRQYIASELVGPERVICLPGGVDVHRFHPGVDGGGARRGLALPEGVPVIGQLAGLRWMKGHRVAIEAARDLARRGRRFHLVFAGQGPMEPRIRAAIADARLEQRISMVGFVHDPAGTMAAFDVALYPSLESEGMSRVVFEYCAVARPLVASRVGVVPEVLSDGEHALLVPAGEPGALAQAMERFLDDPGLRARLGQGAAELIQSRLSGARMTARLVSLYADLAAGGMRHRAPPSRSGRQ